MNYRPEYRLSLEFRDINGEIQVIHTRFSEEVMFNTNAIDMLMYSSRDMYYKLKNELEDKSIKRDRNY